MQLAVTLSRCTIEPQGWYHWAVYAVASLLMCYAAIRLDLLRRGVHDVQHPYLLGMLIFVSWPIAAYIVAWTGGVAACA